MQKESKMQIKEFSSLTGIKRETLRYYDKVGLLSPGLMSISWTQKVKLFYAVLLANNSHCSGVM